MSKRKALVVLMTFLVVLALVFVNATVVLADKGGVPNERAANGAAHANENNDNSAHYVPPPPPPPPTSTACDDCGCTVTGGGWCQADDGELCPCDGGDDCEPLHADPSTCLLGDSNDTCDCLQPPPSPPLPF